MFRHKLQQRQGQTLLAVEIALVVQRVIALAQDGIGQFFGAGLAHAAGNPDDAEIGVDAVVALKAAHALQPNHAVIDEIGQDLVRQAIGRSIAPQVVWRIPTQNGDSR